VTRPLPWTELVAALGEVRFEEVRDSLRRAGTDPSVRDAFLLDGAAGRLLRDLVPEDAPAETLSGYGALLHVLFLAWERGWPTGSLERERLDALLAAPRSASRLTPVEVRYMQLPERVVWAAPTTGASHEPMDGVFVMAKQSEVAALAVLGFRPERAGFTVMESRMPLPLAAPPPRPDGSPPFASVLPAGERARLYSVIDARELALLALLALEGEEG
jgi:hypothetical protein